MKRANILQQTVRIAIKPKYVMSIIAPVMVYNSVELKLKHRNFKTENRVECVLIQPSQKSDDFTVK